ncbi:YjgN family protein [Erythrobacter sp. SD-21]|uniref:YjgN family protein n=1 Tax=Erythrobacter sp. SD-21 TaxID=161528 RepID=UPI000153F96A|nr:YjgN family protein [Erythrobacter sp. SD-21]EDL49670.1 Predicted membrane protein [Erythrobacter sp. SD-21]
MYQEDIQADSAFGFDGNWKDFAKIALPNLLLTLVTLGIYRFWATTRERQYLWSHTRFVDERLEWTGTGKELFVGFLLVMLLFAIPVFGIQFVAQALILRGYEAAGAALGILPILAIFYLTGVARFRALRYRLSRTRWRGIRGGSDDQGLGYGLSYMWKTFVGYLPLGLAIPWSMTSLWNERISKMSFGPYRFESDADPANVFARFLLFYLSPIIFFIGAIIAGATGALAGYGLGGEEGMQVGIIGITIFLLLFFYIGLGLIAVAFYAKFYREVVGSTHWKDLHFGFEASTMDWVKLLIGDALIVVFTLGLGFVFLSYRHWKFMVTHLEAGGDILLDELTQSTTATARHGEGLLDAFDIGAF